MATQSPLQLGMQLGSALRNALTGNTGGMVIASRVPGRRRYTCRNIIGESELCRTLEDMIAAIPGMRTVSVNPVTGSITVTYRQNERYIDAIFDALSHHLAGKHAVQEKTIIPTRMIRVSDNINDTFRYARKKVSTALNHTEPAFISRMAGLALFVYGLNRIANGDRPSGPQIFLWGLALLMRQSHPDPRRMLDGNGPYNNQ